jgi:lactoylglutathione lyase
MRNRNEFEVGVGDEPLDRREILRRTIALAGASSLGLGAPGARSRPGRRSGINGCEERSQEDRLPQVSERRQGFTDLGVPANAAQKALAAIPDRALHQMDGGRVPALNKEASMSTEPDRSAEPKFVVTNTLIVRDIKRSVAFYRDVFGAVVLHEGEPTFLRLGNIWLTINGGGEGTDDKPDVVATPPRDPNVLSNFINLRVAEIKSCYQLWSSRGAQFITETKVHATEMRCYMRDPDGYLIEVGQTTMTAGPLDLYK